MTDTKGNQGGPRIWGRQAPYKNMRMWQDQEDLGS